MYPNIMEYEMDDLHPGAYRCAKNQCWLALEQPHTEADLVQDIVKIAGEIQQGFGLLLRAAGLELMAHSAHVPHEDYDLYPHIYRTIKNTPPPPEQPVQKPVDIVGNVEDLVHSVLFNLHSTLSSVLSTLKHTMVDQEEDKPAIAAKISNNGCRLPTAVARGAFAPDMDLYPSLARSRVNCAHTGAPPHPHTLGEDFMLGLKHTVQDLRRKWVHARLETAAKHEPDLYPDLHRYAVNHPGVAAYPHTGKHAAALADFFDSISALVATAA